MYHEHMSTSKDNELASSEDELDNEEKNENKKEKVEEKIEEKQIRLEQALKKLDTFYNPVLMNLTLDEGFCFVGGGDDNHDNPDTFREAWNHEIPQEREKWRGAIQKEFSDMIRCKVWRHTKSQ